MAQFPSQTAASGIWSLEEQKRAAQGFNYPALNTVIDPQFKHVTLLLHGNGTNGAQNNTFLDSSTNNFTITRNGNTTQGTFIPYESSYSNVFSNFGYLSTPSSNDFAFGTGDFTIEMWVYPTGGGVNSILAGTNTVGGYQAGRWRIEYGSDRAFTITSNFSFHGPVGTWEPYVWTHIAVTRNGTNLRIFKNGALVALFSDGNDLNSAAPVNIGNVPGYTQNFPFSGNISNLQIIKGFAKYTAPFTPDPSPITPSANTVLLTCQGNRLMDNSLNSWQMTANTVGGNGTVTVQPFSPVGPLAPYSAAINGGSAYFDGSGDWLSAPSNAAFDFGTGNFTIEAWGYRTSSGAYGFMLSRRSADVNYGPFSLGLDGSNAPYFACSSSGSSWMFVLTGPALRLNTWFHLAGVRNGNTFTLYVNGVSVGTATSSSSLMASSVGVFVGAHGNGSEPFTGYISDARVVKGSAVYTSNFTPPTAPLTAIANTSLLLNFNNASIVDNAMMNDLETVGTAQISTSVTKFGTGSIYIPANTSSVRTRPNDNMFALGVQPWTVEGWINVVSASPNGWLFVASQAPYTSDLGSFGWGLGYNIGASNSRFVFQINDAGSSFVGIESSNTFSTGTWYHFAASYDLTTMRFFINGNLEGSTTGSYNNNISNLNLFVGWAQIGGVRISAYFDDLRITRGVARYVSNFSVPTAPFPDQ